MKPLYKLAKSKGYTVVRHPRSPFGPNFPCPPLGLKDKSGRIVETGTEAHLRRVLAMDVWNRPLPGAKS